MRYVGEPSFLMVQEKTFTEFLHSRDERCVNLHKILFPASSHLFGFQSSPRLRLCDEQCNGSEQKLPR